MKYILKKKLKKRSKLKFLYDMKLKNKNEHANIIKTLKNRDIIVNGNGKFVSKRKRPDQRTIHSVRSPIGL